MRLVFLAAAAVVCVFAVAGCSDNEPPGANPPPTVRQMAPTAVSEPSREQLEEAQEQLIAPPVVRTGGARVTGGRVVLHGVYAAPRRTRMSFRHGPASGALTLQTTPLVRRGKGRFEQRLPRLRSGRRYAYRAVAENDDYQRAGTRRTFIAP